MILLFPFANKLQNNKPNPKSPPIPWWEELISLIDDDIIQVGIDGEHQLVPNFKKNCSVEELSTMIKDCTTWIGIDSYGQHLCWSLNKYGIVIWGQSNPIIFGHPENINLLKHPSYLMKNQFLKWDMVPYISECFVSPQEVVKYISIFKTGE